MAVRIALRRSREDSARPTDGSVRRDAIASAHRALGSSGAGSSRSRPEHLSFPITGRADYESHRERAARRGKERIRAAEARIAAEMAAAEAADAAARAAAEEEAIRACIVKKRQRRNTRALAREQNRAVRAMAGLPPKEEEDSGAGRRAAEAKGKMEMFLFGSQKKVLFSFACSTFLFEC